MYKNVKILLIEDDSYYSSIIKKSTNLVDAQVLYYDFSNVNQMWQEGQTDEKIKDYIKNNLNAFFFSNTEYKNDYWVVLLDYELYKLTQDPIKHRIINRTYRDAVVNTLRENDRVFLIPYTHLDPEGCSFFYDEIHKLISDNKTKFNLYYRVLLLNMGLEPTNYKVVFKRFISREIRFIAEEKKNEKGEINNEHWIHA